MSVMSGKMNKDKVCTIIDNISLVACGDISVDVGLSMVKSL